MNGDAFSFARPEWLGEVTSTNDLLKDRVAADRSLPPGTIVAARRQTRGRGRMDSGWLSSPRGDLHFSFYWSGRVEPFQAATLPMACALGVGDFLAREPWRIESLCKWPNDVLAGDGKICGILTEAVIASEERFGVVVGIGVNIRSEPGRDAALGRKTAALEDFAGPVGDAGDLLPLLLADVEARIAAWEIGGFGAIRRDLEKRWWGMGRAISVKTAAGRVEGVVAGLGGWGELLMRGADGTITPVASVTAIEGGWNGVEL
ncbi:MAG: biotin--[acetyl-CoA-carboxylase] ligase [Planctomycetota bacterium]|jgi:BirA family biotin operon repressor/biotin-[acetyl-CoA-carboxylase] ligase|nr:biotin--[acetyl-CoA-carboxylase] ligase [Planctomycetota bacterium]